jgi:uncharacterized membrane protein YhaH (DUF805 family)
MVSENAKSMLDLKSGDAVSGVAEDPSSDWPMFNLWSFRGRIGRRKFWIESILLFILCLFVEFLTGPVEYDSRAGTHPPILLFVPYIAISWLALAATVKRWHDLDHSGWMTLLNFAVIPVPFTFIYTYFFRGTKGPNRFGANPI